MKGCLQTVVAIIFFIIVFTIGYGAYNVLNESDSSQSPDENSSTPPPTSQTTQQDPETGPTQTPLEESLPKAQLPEKVNEESSSTELITREYNWSYKGDWTWEGKIPLSSYKYYQETPRPPTQNYSVFITHPLDDPYIDLLVEKIKKAAQQESYDEYQTVEFAAAFVQGLPYTIDSVTSPYDEYPRYPIETLVDNGGDCEDTSILLASIINKMGYGVVLIMLPDHCAVGVKGGDNIHGVYWDFEGDKYYYLETTGTGWGIGELPEEYKDTKAHLFPIIPIPIITHEWSFKGRGFWGELEVTISNLGTAKADNIYIFTGFDAGNDQVWSGKQSESFQIEANNKVTVRLIIQAPPLNVHTRIVVQIIMDNHSINNSYSEWFDT